MTLKLLQEKETPRYRKKIKREYPDVPHVTSPVLLDAIRGKTVVIPIRSSVCDLLLLRNSSTLMLKGVCFSRVMLARASSIL